VRTYTKAFGEYQNQTVEVLPLRMAADATETTVKTTINKPGAQPLPVDYEMKKKADGWKAFDIVINGASMVMSYRGTFDSEIRQNGIDGLIRTLSEKNISSGSMSLREAEKK
jgi:phospholipid transport system substrate-binding protein